MASDQVAHSREFGAVAHPLATLRRVVPYAMLAAGAMLLVATAGYYAYAYWAKSDLDSLKFATERPSPVVDGPHPNLPPQGEGTLGQAPRVKGLMGELSEHGTRAGR